MATSSSGRLDRFRAEAARVRAEIERMAGEAARTQAMSGGAVQRLGELELRRARLLRAIARETGAPRLVPSSDWKSLTEYDIEVVAAVSLGQRLAFVVRQGHRWIAGAAEPCLEVRTEWLGEYRRQAEELYEQFRGTPGAYEVDRSPWRARLLELGELDDSDRIGPLTFGDVVHWVLIGRESLLHVLGGRPLVIHDGSAEEPALVAALQRVGAPSA